MDTLLLNVYYVDEQGQPTKRVLDSSLVTLLEALKHEAQMAGEPVPTSWSFQEASFLIRPNGAGRGHWQWILISPLLTVCVSMGKWNGGIAQVRCSSEYLWSAPSLETAIRQAHDFLRVFFGVTSTYKFLKCISVWMWQGGAMSRIWTINACLSRGRANGQTI